MTLQKRPLLGTGLSGLIGSKFMELNDDLFTFENIDLSTHVDILNETQVLEYVARSASDVIIHFAAFTDVEAAFLQSGDKEGMAYKVNVLGTRNMVKAAKQTGKHLIHISTAFVFDGEKTTPYQETDATRPIEWYGQTKVWAEEEVTSGLSEYTILRIDRPYRLDSFEKLDILHKILEKIKTNTLPPQFSDTSWTPTKIETFSTILTWVAQNKPNGIFHATTEEIFSDFTFANWVVQTFHLDAHVQEGSLTKYLQTHERPYQRNTALDSSKLLAIMKE